MKFSLLVNFLISDTVNVMLDIAHIRLISHDFAVTFFAVQLVFEWSEEPFITLNALEKFHVKMSAFMVIFVAFSDEFSVTDSTGIFLAFSMDFKVMGQAALVLKSLSTVSIVALIDFRVTQYIDIVIQMVSFNFILICI